MERTEIKNQIAKIDDKAIEYRSFLSGLGNCDPHLQEKVLKSAKGIFFSFS